MGEIRESSNARRQFGENRLGCAREGILEWLWDGVAVRIPPISALCARDPSPDGPLAGLCVRIQHENRETTMFARVFTT